MRAVRALAIIGAILLVILALGSVMAGLGERSAHQAWEEQYVDGEPYSCGTTDSDPMDAEAYDSCAKPSAHNPYGQGGPEIVLGFTFLTAAAGLLYVS